MILKKAFTGYNMKKLILFLFFILFAYAEKLPELDPEKPIYQKKWGGVVIAWPVGDVDRVRLPDPKTIDELKLELKKQNLKHEEKMKQQARENEMAEHKKGSWLKVIGWLAVAIGAAAHFATSVPALKSISSSIITLGIAMVIAGLGIQKTAELNPWVKLAIVVVIVGVSLYFARNKDIKDMKNSISSKADKLKNKIGETLISRKG